MMATPDDRFARLGTLAFLLFGILLRIVRWCLDFPLWGDEVFVCQNFPERDFRTILLQLENGQICPPLFLWLELAAYRMFGGSDQAVRFMPLLAGILALVGLRSLALRLLAPRAAVLAVGLLAVATWPVSLSTFCKPYTFDLLMAVLLQLAAVRCWQQPEAGRFALLAVAMPLAILGSYPAVFVGGAVMLALFVFNLEIGKHQLEGDEAPAIHAFLKDYWKDGFPPSEWWQWPRWLLEGHTGRMMAYPAGDAHFGSTATFILFCFGVYRWVRAKRWALLVLFLVPFALNLLAAILGKYPYAACGRLSQHLAPAICLIAADGIVQLIEWRHKLPRSQRIAMGCFLGLFFALGLGAMVYWVAVPYHDTEAKWMRDIPREIDRNCDPRLDALWVTGEERHTPNVLRWYLKHRNPKPVWLGREQSHRLSKDDWRVWVVDCWNDTGENAERAVRVPALPEGWIVRGQARYHLRPEPGTEYFYHCTITVYGSPQSPIVVLKSQP